MNWSFIEYFLFSVSSLDFNQSASFLIKINHNMYSMAFGYQSLLKQHISMFHNGSKSIQMEKDKSFMCDICSKIFFCKSNLKVHKATQHDKILQFSCEICAKHFGQKVQLDYHNNLHHNQIYEPKPIQIEKCEKLCEKMFSNSEDLCNHVRNDHLVSNYQYIGSFLAKNYICKLEAL